jgi:hypothetical protein
MAKLSIKKASTDVTVYVFIQSAAGAGVTDFVYDTSGLIAYYVRPLGSATAITLATQTVTGAHSDGGFVEVSKDYMPGIYRLDLPDAVCATGVNSVVVMLSGGTAMLPVALEIQLTDFDLNDATPLVTVNDIVTDAITADSIKTDAITEIQTGLATPTNITAGTIATVTNVTNGVTLADDAITAAKFDESTAFPLKSADTGATQVARVGADSDTLETLSDEIDGIKTVVDDILEDTGDLGVVVVEAVEDSITDLSLSAAAIIEIQTGLATTLHLQEVEDKIDTIDTNVDAVLVDTGTTIPALIAPLTAGIGAVAKTYTEKDASTGLGIADVTVWVTTDLAGANVVASGLTNSSGQVIFYLDSGVTYYIWRQKDGIDFINPEVEVA